MKVAALFYGSLGALSAATFKNEVIYSLVDAAQMAYMTKMVHGEDHFPVSIFHLDVFPSCLYILKNNSKEIYD
jgi:hypothetical protein